ncbi:hypothetical protein niasHT_027577 [Heterodera trifolii]|uniref:Uncharacterized protein n=1 Tax=Heterodera trifolii TaxID=157864 RepID=A0ABD2K561_9BILA
MTRIIHHFRRREQFEVPTEYDGENELEKGGENGNDYDNYYQQRMQMDNEFIASLLNEDNANGGNANFVYGPQDETFHQQQQQQQYNISNNGIDGVEFVLPQNGGE